MIVRDIVERDTASPNEPSQNKTPMPPRPPVAGVFKAGFPVAPHRSTRPATSAFARGRRDDATRAAGGLAPGQGRMVHSIPQVASAGTSGSASEALQRSDIGSRAEAADDSAMDVDDDGANDSDVAPPQRHGLDAVELMHKRRASQDSGTPRRFSTTGSAGGEQSDTDKIRADIDVENREKMQDMSSAEIANEVQDLEERFSPALLARLRARAEGRATTAVAHSETSTARAGAGAGAGITTTTTSTTSAMAVDPPSEPQPPSPADAVSNKQRRRSVRFQDEDSTPGGLRAKYFPDAPANDAKLEWMEASSQSVEKQPTTECDSTSPRFNLSGAPLSAEAAAALPTHLGLHHHGDQPDLAGYTTDDIVRLSYSTVASQRITMMGVLGKVVVRFRQAEKDGSTEPWVQSLKEEDIVAKGIDVASTILGSHTRSIGVLVAAVDLLFKSLGGPEWSWMEEDEGERLVPFRPEPMKDGEPTGVASVPYDDIIPHLTEVLGLDAGDLPPTTLEQLLLILQRGALNSPTGAETVAPLVPIIVKAHVLRAPWPLDPSRSPNALALRLLHDVTASSRPAAEALLRQSVYEPLLKFVASEMPSEPHARKLVLEVLQIFYALGRYGMSASIATSTREIWQQLGTWVSTQVANPTPGSDVLVCAYFDLLRVWTVCAIDPHRTTPDHDFTWAQMSALQWIDEELAVVEALQGSERYAELAASLAAVTEYVVGAQINGVRHGETEKRVVLDALTKMDIIGHLPPGVDVMPHGDNRGPFNKYLTQIFRLHNLFRSSGMKLIEFPERERYIWWFAASTQSNREDVDLRCAFLETARLDNVLDIPKWATSAFDTILSCTPGDEPMALQLVDDILRTDWAKAGVNGGEIISSIGHKDGLEILRPLLHHAVLPELENVLAPTWPSYLYLKASGTLRTNYNLPDSGPGLPLATDWFFSPLNELLASGSSEAFALAPKDWDASETQLTRATLALAIINLGSTSSPVSTSEIILNAMKVFMLEHGQQDAPNTENDVFRDATVSAALKELLDTLGPNEFLPTPRGGPLENAAKRFLGKGVPFFQFYQDLHALYEAVSFGDNLFARVLLPPLAMNYDVDYRRLFWAEQTGALRSVRVKDNEVPLESGTPAVYFASLETDTEVLTGLARAVVGPVREETSPFLFRVAVHHLAGLFWNTTDEERNGLRVQALVVILSSAPDSVIRALLVHDVEDAYAPSVSEEIVKARVETVARLTGPRGAQRLAAAGF